MYLDQVIGQKRCVQSNVAWGCIVITVLSPVTAANGFVWRMFPWSSWVSSYQTASQLVHPFLHSSPDLCAQHIDYAMEFCQSFGHQKTCPPGAWCCLRDHTFSHSDRTPMTYVQTDGHTDRRRAIAYTALV